MFIKKAIAAVFIAFMSISVASAQSMNTVYQVKPPQTTVDVALPENPSTGYRWYLTDYSQALISSVEYHYQAAKESIPGAQGMGHFIISLSDKAFDAPSRIAVTLVQARPWEIGKGRMQTVYLVTMTH